MVWDNVPLSEGPQMIEMHIRLRNQWFQTAEGLHSHNKSLLFNIQERIQNNLPRNANN